ncbi:MAG: LysR family transcriptional regulator [Thermoanaerobacterales bacterium]
MNLQQLRYLVATADEGTMTRAAAALHVAQPALSRGIRGLEVELGITAFERRGRGVTLTPEGAEAVAIARRVLAEVDRLTAIGRLRVCSVRGQATEIASPVIARLVTGGHGRARLDAVDTPAEVFDQVRQGRADVGVTDLPAPVDLWVTSLGWQEIVLMHPPRWELDDPLDVRRLDGLPLLSPGSDDWRHRAVQDHLRALGLRASITAEAGDSELMLELVLAGAGAWFVYGHDAEAARAAGAGVVHLRPTVVREVGVVAASEPAAAAARAFVEAARAETAGTLLPSGHPRLDGAVWLSGRTILRASPGAPQVEA